MKKLFLFSCAALLFVAVGCEKAPHSAKSEFLNAEGQVIGTAKLEEVEGGVKISVEVSGLTPGLHGIHIHDVGKCEIPDFKSAGPHFNPDGKKHGHMNPEGAHAGDLPNLVVGADGKGSAEIVVKGVTLKRGGNSLFHSGGTSIVIHAQPDDEKTDPSGNSGDRIACGVIIK